MSALAAIGGKWKLIIVYWVAESPKYYAAISASDARQFAPRCFCAHIFWFVVVKLNIPSAPYRKTVGLKVEPGRQGRKLENFA